MTSLIRSTLLLFRTHFVRLLISKRTGFCALLALGPAALATMILSLDKSPPPGHEVAMYPGWFLLLQVVVPLVSLIAGSAVFAEEVDDRTVTYLFTRPFPRAALLLGRWLATATILALLLGGGALALVLVCRGLAPAEQGDFPEGIAAPLIQMAVLGGAVYSAVFAAGGTFLRRPMIVGLAYTFVIEVVLANVPGKSQGLAILYHLRSYVAQASGLWAEVYEENMVELEPRSDSLTTLAIVLVAALVVGSVVVSRKQYVLTS
jgi:ABC-type transport system involved in multi-copper enzyme maturation permease subunit